MFQVKPLRYYLNLNYDLNNKISPYRMLVLYGKKKTCKFDGCSYCGIRVLTKLSLFVGGISNRMNN